jgi:hypothetical protein
VRGGRGGATRATEWRRPPSGHSLQAHHRALGIPSNTTVCLSPERGQRILTASSLSSLTPSLCHCTAGQRQLDSTTHDTAHIIIYMPLHRYLTDLTPPRPLHHCADHSLHWWRRYGLLPESEECLAQGGVPGHQPDPDSGTRHGAKRHSGRGEDARG